MGIEPIELNECFQDLFGWKEDLKITQRYTSRDPIFSDIALSIGIPSNQTFGKFLETY